MTKSHLIAAATLLLALVARAADEPSNVQSVAVPASAASAAVVCKREVPTGSTIAVKVCRTVDVDADGRMTEEARRRIQQEAATAAQQNLNSRGGAK